MRWVLVLEMRVPSEKSLYSTQVSSSWMAKVGSRPSCTIMWHMEWLFSSVFKMNLANSVVMDIDHEPFAAQFIRHGWTQVGYNIQADICYMRFEATHCQLPILTLICEIQSGGTAAQTQPPAWQIYNLAGDPPLVSMLLTGDILPAWLLRYPLLYSE